MESLDITKFKRNPKFMDKYTITKGNNVTAKEELYYLFPDKFLDKNLAVIDVTSTLLACMAICNNKDEYAVLNLPCKIKVSPSSTEEVMIGDVLYQKVVMDEGDLIIDDLKYVKNGNMVYHVFEYFVIQGKIPWYLEYEDVFELFNNIPEYTATSVGKDPLVFEILTSIITRTQKDIKISYRNAINTEADKINTKARYIGLMDIWYTFKSTLSKIAGSYMKDGIVSSIVNGPGKEATDLEKIIRS